MLLADSWAFINKIIYDGMYKTKPVIGILLYLAKALHKVNNELLLMPSNYRNEYNTRTNKYCSP